MRPRALLPVFLGLALVLFLAAAEYFLDLFGPFALALFFTALIDPAVSRLERAGIPRGTAAVIVILGAGAALAGAGWLLLVNVLREAELLRVNLPEYAGFLKEAAERWTLSLERAFAGLPHPLDDAVAQSIDRLLEHAGSVASALVARAGGLPASAFVLFVAAVTSYFLCRDKRSLGDFLFGLVPNRWHPELRRLKGEIASGLLGFARAQCILVLLSGTLSVLGLWVFGYRYAWLLGLLAGILDLVPMVGPSGIFLPLIMWGFAAGELSRPLGVGAVWAAVLVVRQIVEPDIVGRHVGLHPVTSLVAVYVGGKLLGVNGLLLGPVAAVILKAVWVVSVLPYRKQE